MKKNLTYLLPLGVATTLVSCAGSTQTQQNQRPNVVFIYADDIGYGDLSCYGTGTVPTAACDKLASEGIKYLDAHCSSATSTPSRYSMLTGEYAWRRPDTGIAAGDAAMIIKPEQFTIADMFKMADYNTAVIGKWHLGIGDQAGAQNWNELISPNPSDLGFDYSYIMAATGDRTPCIYLENGRGVSLDPNDPVYVSYTTNFEGEPTGKDNPELLKLHPSHGHDNTVVNGVSRIGYMKGGHLARWDDEYIADSITLKAIDYIERQAECDEPFFLYFATNDIHVPRVPNPRFAGKSGLGARGDALLSFDYSVDQVLSTIERLGLEENTIIILSSDNGAVLDDGYHDGAVERLGDHMPTGALRGGKYSIFEGGTRIPCIIKWSGVITPGESAELMSQVDWLRSLATLLGVKLPKGVACDSENQLASWMDANSSGREYIIEQNLDNNLAISDGEWKYIPSCEGDAMNIKTNTELGNNTTMQLYNLVSDISERYNVASENPEIVERLDGKLSKIRNIKLR